MLRRPMLLTTALCAGSRGRPALNRCISPKQIDAAVASLPGLFLSENLPCEYLARIRRSNVPHSPTQPTVLRGSLLSKSSIAARVITIGKAPAVNAPSTLE
jgi:hypothetical protein